MEIIGKVVNHKTWNKGKIISLDGKFITVQFASKTSKFIYPDAFIEFLDTDDVELKTFINDYIDEKETKAKEAKRIEDEKRKAEDNSNKKVVNTFVNKAIAATKRIPGRRMAFFVFQGTTFGAEFSGGYLWAPKYNAAGNTFHHWDRLLDVREGDLILHGVDGNIVAISVAKGSCYDCDSPRELDKEHLWAKTGRKVDCNYTKLSYPVSYSAYREENKKYAGVKYAPFNKDGNGNMGYLFVMHNDQARFYIELALKKNKYLLDLDSIQEFLK